MNRPVKIILYIVFITMAVGFGIAAKNQVHLAAASEKQRQKNLDEAVAIESETNARAIEITNAPSSENTNTAAAESTNLPAAEATNIVPRKAAPPVSGPQRSYSKMISYTLLCAVGFVGFAFLLARDVSLLLAHKAEQALFSDDGAPVDPEYEQAEELWKDGKYLETLNGMREYLNKHPREQYVALRIAEIYEQNLSNPLAAALEYEEVLKKNLPAERWGWAAIHLANIYSGKLNQPEKAVALLHRIDAEYGKTSAANKARERLAQIDPNFVPAAAVAAPVAGDTAVSPQPSNLPPGFRPK